MADEASKALETAKMLVKQGRGEKAHEAAVDAQALFQKAGNSEGVCKALRVVLVAACIKDGYKEAERLAGEELEKAKKGNDPKAEASMLLATAEVHLEGGCPKKAVPFAQDAAELFYKVLDKKGGVAATVVQAEAHCSLDQPKAALNAAIGALDNKDVDESLQAAAWLVVMKARLAIGKYEDAMKAAEAALVIYLRSGDSYGKARTLYSIADAHAANQQYQKALKAGNMALELCRQLEAQKWEADTLEVIVQALIRQEAKDEALRQAKTGVAYLQRSGDKVTTATAMQTVMRAHVAKGDHKQALEVAKEAVAVFREAGDRRREAAMLQEISTLHSSLGQLDEAMSAAAASAPLYRDLGDQAGQSSATDMVGAVEDAKAMYEQEDQRKSLLKDKLEALKSALENRNGQQYKDVMDDLYSDENVTMDDVDAIVEPIAQKDPEGTVTFMQENHPENWPLEEEGAKTEEQLKSEGRCDKKAWYFERRFLYYMFRVNMMGYGPGLRCVKTAYRISEDDPSIKKFSQGISSLNLKDDHDDWEAEVGFHPGVIDCALQTSAVRGYDLRWLKGLQRQENGNFHHNPNKRHTIA